MTQQAQTRSTLPILLSLGMVVLCLVLGGGFVWWYLKGPGQTATVTLSSDDLAALQSAGRRLNYQANGGAPLNANQFGGGGGMQPRRPPPPEPDGIFMVGSLQVIRAGQVLVRVQPAPTAGAEPKLVFRQRTWGLLADFSTFTIARRIAHEESLAKQLLITPEQLTPLTKIAGSPVLKAAYLTALPVPDQDMDRAHKAWTDYNAALVSNNKDTISKSKADLIKTVREIGVAAMARARKEYADADKDINAVLEPRQIEAYRQGKSLAP
jgi:hypothetical protein